MLLERLITIFVSVVSLLIFAYSFRQLYLVRLDRQASEECSPTIPGSQAIVGGEPQERFCGVVFKKVRERRPDVLRQEYERICFLFRRAGAPLRVMIALTEVVRLRIVTHLANTIRVFHERFSAAAASGDEQISQMMPFFVSETGNRAPPLKYPTRRPFRSRCARQGTTFTLLTLQFGH